MSLHTHLDVSLQEMKGLFYTFVNMQSHSLKKKNIAYNIDYSFGILLINFDIYKYFYYTFKEHGGHQKMFKILMNRL